jgi:hypothetical protein
LSSVVGRKKKGEPTVADILAAAQRFCKKYLQISSD